MDKEKKIPLIENRIIIPRSGNIDDETRENLVKELEKISNNMAESASMEVDSVNYESKIEEYCSGFRTHIKGVLDIDRMIYHFKNQLRTNKIKIYNNKMGRNITIDGLDYEICILDLGNYDNYDYNITERMSPSSFINEKIQETNIEGLNEISKQGNKGWEIPNENDIKQILRKLKKTYPSITPNNSNSHNDNSHDEDIALFMLVTQSYGEFLLKGNRVFKCYDAFRGFRNARDCATGQVLLIRKK